MKTADKYSAARKPAELMILHILNRPVGTIMLWLGLILGGLWSASNMRTDFLPDFSVPKITITAPYQGLPAEEIRSLITIPLEDSLSSVNELRNISSISRDGLSLIELEFPWGTDRTEACIRTRSIIDLAWHSLPSDAPKPQVLSIDPADMPIITLAVFPVNGSLSLTRRIADRELRSRLQRINGVGSIQVSGGLTDEIQVYADPSLIAARGYTFSDVSKALRSSNIDFPAGTVTEGSTEYLVKTRSRTEDLTALGNIRLPSKSVNDSAASIRLKDVAEISIGSKEQNSIFFLADSDHVSGREGICVQIRRSNGFSPAEMADNIRREIDEIQRSFEQDLEIRIISDKSQSLKRAIHNLSTALITGALLSFAVVLFFMRDLQKALLLLVPLPVSLLLSILLLFLAGKSLNLMSLGGLAVGVGMIIDNSIVAVERLSRLSLSSLDKKEQKIKIAETMSNLAPSLTGSTVTTVIVFTPLLFISGLTGVLFGDLALSVIFSLIASLLLSLTLIPLLFYKLKPSDSKNITHCGSLYRLSVKIIKTGLRHPLIYIFLTAGFCLSCIFPAAELDLDIIKTVNEGLIHCSLRLAPGTGIESTKQLAAKLSEALIENPDIISISASSGGEPANPYYLASTEESPDTIQFYIKHKPNCRRTQILADIKRLLDVEFGTLDIKPPENILSNLIGIKNTSDWVLKGESHNSARDSAELLAKKLDNAEIIPADYKTHIIISPDRAALSFYGIELPQLAGFINNSISGIIESSIKINGENTDICLRTIPEYRNETKDIIEMNFPAEDTDPVRLLSVISIHEEQTLPWLLREGRKDLSLLRLSSIPDAKQTQILKDGHAVPRKVPLFMQQLPELLLIAASAAVMLYLCLGIQFESFSLPLFLMLIIPPSSAGIIYALVFTNHSLNMNSFLGLLTVMGISVNNGILLYEEASSRLGQPKPLPAAALYKGTLSRVNPILMTSLTTIIALFPLAVDPFGTSSQSSLAVSIIGGLSTSVIISFLLLPVIIKFKITNEAS